MLSSGAFTSKNFRGTTRALYIYPSTTEKHKIIPTILSRCQVYSFKRISIDGIVNHLKIFVKKKHRF